MDLERAVEILKKTRRGFGDPEPWRFVGDELLRCGACAGPVAGRDPRASGYSRLHSMYACRACGAGGILVPVADGQLQAIAVRYWSRPERVASWRRERLVVLDAEIAELLAVGEYARNPKHRRTLKRALRQGWWLMRQIGRDAPEPQASLVALVRRLTDLIHERASLAAALDGRRAAGAAARLAELDRLRLEHSVLSDPIIAHFYPGIAAAFGDRRQREARVPEVERQLWVLLTERTWADAKPESPPTRTDVLTKDWAESPTTHVRARRALLRITAADWPLVLYPRTEKATAYITALTVDASG